MPLRCGWLLQFEDQQHQLRWIIKAQRGSAFNLDGKETWLTHERAVRAASAAPA